MPTRGVLAFACRLSHRRRAVLTALHTGGDAQSSSYAPGSAPRRGWRALSIRGGARERRGTAAGTSRGRTRREAGLPADGASEKRRKSRHQEESRNAFHQRSSIPARSHRGEFGQSGHRHPRPPRGSAFLLKLHSPLGRSVSRRPLYSMQSF